MAILPHVARSVKAECILNCKDILGEVPVWDPEGDRIWWLDVSRASLQSLEMSTGRHEVRQLPGKTVGGWAPRKGGGAVVALDSGLHRYGFERVGALIAEIPPPESQATHRVNEAAVDCLGRLWIGTMERSGESPTGGIHLLDPAGTIRNVRGGLLIPNGICFDPSYTTVYFADSRRRTIWAQELDPIEGGLGAQRRFHDFYGIPGMPDGAAIDVEGCLWIACFGGWRVVRIDPTGRVDLSVELPVEKVTSVAFGGSDMRTLFITTASGKLTEHQLAEQPLAGALFAVHSPVSGFIQPPFAG
ncbi:SMP-30/gluconolactonase/LRE family protein [Chelativorans sp. SCAU2101]|uniref:SMP-30/gluconolactonase/LRE family protein n=1 Tax=Chelativorans petroleitrophicus TaxID=2975484 RepID=A0A9X2X6K3_9HYPH|nr:SMP-30/gluconolactonase/LRE family protein [Chelativorans petroleitrophicus]